jgi:hypothetical protein
MSFNLGISGGNRLGNSNLFSIALYLYEDIFYRKWISEVALAFYEGRQDEFVWLDLVKQFRNPEKQQIVPLNFTKEIIDETSILYREQPIYKVKDKETGKLLKDDQKLWEDVMQQARYHTMMDRLDRWCKLLGTVMVKVNYINPYTGNMAEEDDEDGKITLDLLHGGTYDVKYKGSPYHVNQLIIGFDSNFKGFGGGVSQSLSVSGNLGVSEVVHRQQVQSIQELNKVTEIFWSPDKHIVSDKGTQKHYEIDNPYGMIPAVPFFNSDPAHYYFLPVNEPLIYMNHTLNMRMTDLNHIAKFQSFGVPVLSGVERGTNLRTGRPQDDFNVLKGGLAQSRFGGLGIGGAFGQGINFRNFDTNYGFFVDGNAEANALGFSLGPDTAISVGEKGDFKFASPNADITGLMKVIESMQDIVRVNHGLRPKFKQTLPSSGFAQLMEKIGVLEENLRRQKLFREREQQLFEVIKTIWNGHHKKTGDTVFSDDSYLDITYVEPDFPTDPMTKMQTIQAEQAIIESGDTRAIQKIYKHKGKEEVQELIKQYHDDRKKQTERNLELQTMEREAQRGMEMEDANHQVGVDSALTKSPLAVPLSQMAKLQGGGAGGKKPTSPGSHSMKSSIQPKKNGDTRKKV